MAMTMLPPTLLVPRRDRDDATMLRRPVSKEAAPTTIKRARKDEKQFMSRVTMADSFWRSLASFSKNHGLDQEELEGFAEELCRCCWSEAGDMMTDEEGLLADFKAEKERMKAKLVQCNLSAMKQITACKVGGHADAELADDLVTFHEPLQFLDKDTKDLVLLIVLEKARLLEQGRAPPSLLEALTKHADAMSKNTEGADMAVVKELREELEEARAEVRKARIRADDAEDRARKADSLVALAEAKAREAQQALAELQQREAALRAEHETLKEKSAQQQAEIERQQVELLQQRSEIERQRCEIERQREEIERQQAEIQRVTEELELEREANATLRAEVARLKDCIEEYVKRVQKLEGDLQELQARYDTLEEEANAMREELARRNNCKTKGTQTNVTGQKMDEQTAEVKRLKLMLEEMQMKMKELMDKCRRKFGNEVSQIAEDMGLKELMKEETVFQRLYDDAMDRVERLEKLRLRVKTERNQMWPAGAAQSPRSVAKDPAAGYPAMGSPCRPSRLASPQMGVREEVEQSSLQGLRRIARDAEHRECSPKTMGSRKSSKISSSVGVGDDPVEPPTRSLKASASLPAIGTAAPQAQMNASVSTFQIEYGADGYRDASTRRRRSSLLPPRM